jgi:hypothetical protein
MKKFLALLAVVALVCLSSMAFAADVTVGGSLEIRSRDFNNLAPGLVDTNHSKNAIDTQERIRLDVNAKAGDDVKGKIELEQGWDTGTQDWGSDNGGVDVPAASYPNGSNSALGFREAWMSVNLPGIPVNVTAGHQLLQLGNGWFFRSKHFGNDAWVVSNQTGNNTFAFVDIKISEGKIYTNDDVDTYTLLDVFKLSDTATVGIDLTFANDPRNALLFSNTTPTTVPDNTQSTNAQNLGLNFNGKTGPMSLKAEVDLQMGKAKGNDAKFKGNQIVVQGTMAMEPATLNFTVARGSGDKIGSGNYDGIKTFLDIDPHYTFLYEYKLAAPVNSPFGNQLHQGFENTTALNVGASVAAAKSLTVGANLWYLRATEKVPNVKSGSGTTNDIGTELDVNVAWKLYDNVSWNWDLGYFMPGDGMGKDAATGVQGILAFKF